MSWAIKTENLGKKYRRGHVQILSNNLRESLMHFARETALRLNPFGRLTRSRRGGSRESPAPDTEEFWALRNVNLEIQEGEIVGLIGSNGAGKSTLLKILSRITTPSFGEARVRGQLASLLEIGSGFHRELTGRENIFLNGSILGMKRSQIHRKLDQIVAFAEIEKFLDTPVKFYSSGMYVRLAFSVAAHLDADVLLVDEVLAVGDLQFQEKCMGQMEEVSKGGRTIIFVSHNMDSIRKLCPKAILLDGGRVQRCDNTAEIIEEYVGRYHTREHGYAIDICTDGKPGQYYVQKIEILDKQGLPMPLIRTWDSVTFRIVFHSPSDFEGGSVVLMLSTLSGNILLMTSTQPDHQRKTPFKQGLNSIDCRIETLMLASGKYLIGAGLAVPNVEMLFHAMDAGVLNVLPNDVYGSGLPPSNSRYLIPMNHHWGESKPLQA